MAIGSCCVSAGFSKTARGTRLSRCAAPAFWLTRAGLHYTWCLLLGGEGSSVEGVFLLHFILKPRNPVWPVAVVTRTGMGARIYRHGSSAVLGLTREGHWAFPYLKRGRGNLCDNSIYFSTGWFASRAGRKRLLEFSRPATSLGRASGPAAGGVLRESLLTPASPHPPSRAGTAARVPAGACQGREGWPVCCG